MVEDYKYYELERKINETLHECLVEKRFLVNRLEKLQARKEQIFSEMYTSRAGRAVENPFTVREELRCGSICCRKNDTSFWGADGIFAGV